MIYKTKETAIKHLKQGELFSNKSFELFRNDRECVLEALKMGKSFTHYPQEWLGDKELSKAFLLHVDIPTNESFNCSSIGTSLLDDKNFIYDCFNWIVENESSLYLCFNEASIYFSISPKLKEDKDIAMMALTCAPLSIYLMSQELRSDTDILTAFIKGLNNFLFASHDLCLAIRHSGLPHQHWETHGNTDEMEEYLKALKSKKRLEEILAEKRKQKTIKI